SVRGYARTDRRSDSWTRSLHLSRGIGHPADGLEPPEQRYQPLEHSAMVSTSANVAPPPRRVAGFARICATQKKAPLSDSRTSRRSCPAWTWIETSPGPGAPPSIQSRLDSEASASTSSNCVQSAYSA